MAAEPIEVLRGIVHDAQFAAKSFDLVGADEIEALLRSVQDAVNVLQEVQRLAVSSAVRFDVWSSNGFRSPAHWLATLTGLPLGVARSVVGRAEVLSQLPLVQSVALAGGLHELQVRDLAALAERAGPFFDVDVDLEVAVAADEGPAAFAALVRGLYQCLEDEEAAAERARQVTERRGVEFSGVEFSGVEFSDAGLSAGAGAGGGGGGGGEPTADDGGVELGDGDGGHAPPASGEAQGGEECGAGRGLAADVADVGGGVAGGLFGAEGSAVGTRFSLYQRPDGWWAGTVFLSPVDGEIVSAALDREIDRYLRAQRDGDPSLSALDIPNLRAQALVDVVAIRREPSGYSTPDRFQVALNVTVQPDGTVRPDGPFPAEAACDSEMYRIVWGAAGEVLDVGRSTRHWTPAMSRAIRRRDGQCRYPDCDRPSRQCDIHHCQHWEHGGHTSIDNGVLLCRWHHGFIHRQRWRVEVDPDSQKPTFRKPDGTIHTSASQRAARE